MDKLGRQEDQFDHQNCLNFNLKHRSVDPHSFGMAYTPKPNFFDI